jgi:hypothetical protein
VFHIILANSLGRYFVSLTCYTYRRKLSHASGDIEVETVEDIVSAVDPIGIDIPRGTFLLGRFNSSIVIPSSFVMPTTGGSPFLTNSYIPIPMALDLFVPAEGIRGIFTRHFVPG